MAAEARAGEEPRLAQADLREALQLAEPTGAALLTGRARLKWACSLTDPATRRSALEQASQELATSQPWYWQARLAVAETEPPTVEARAEAGRALARFLDMGMQTLADRARQLVAQA